MNTWLLISSAIDTHASKDKHQIALWDGCKEHVASRPHNWLNNVQIL